MAEDDDKVRINPGYAFGQLLKALASSGERAAERVRKWQGVILGLADGSLRVGSRTPVAEAPPWVTLDVLHGGFASGNLAAGGVLKPHETQKLALVAREPGSTERAALNLHFLGELGRTELDGLLADGRFRIEVPEEAALPVAAWLIRHGEAERAAELIETISPFFDRLRFYPVPHARPMRTTTDVCVQPAGLAVKALRAKRRQMSVERMNEAVRVWTPLHDRSVALFLETVEGETPSFRRSVMGLERASNGQPVVTGGWPCRRYPDDWKVRARGLLADYRVARSEHALCKKPDQPKENFARLRGYLEKCCGDPRSLSGRDVGMIRKILASCISQHGAPGSAELATKRARDARVAERPTHVALAQGLAARLSEYAEDEGVPDVEDVVERFANPDPLPESLQAKAMRCLEAPLDVLVAKEIVPSSEAMATVLPSLTSKVRADAISDRELQRLYQAAYVAFRRRRSLLLLNLESQVRLGELPWIRAVEPWVGSDDASRAAARSTLTQAVTLSLRAFPQTILPNKLLKELRALSRDAGLSLPFVDELAADIFMGSFSENFLRAGQAAARLLRGTLYERYYGLPFERLLSLDDLEKRHRVTVSPGFLALCTELAGPSEGQGSWIAKNGKIIEQQQILTTHNLAALFAELELARELDLLDLARRAFEWVCRSQEFKGGNVRAQLQTLKNSAYAWRQMIFFLSLSPSDRVTSFLERAQARLGSRGEPLRRFAPALVGLRAIAAGDRFGPDGIHAPSGGRRFLGWSVGGHWLLPPRDEKKNSR
jgi:hypothetical protein